MTFKVFIIAAFVVFAEAADPDVLSKRDNAAVEVDPYAAYYEQYASQVAESQEVPFTQYVSEKQGFAGTMENALGPDAALVLGTIGALMGTLAAIGVVVVGNDLSTDQDSICTTAKALGNTAITALTSAEITAMNAAGSANVGGTKLAEVITALNGYATPSC